MNTTTKTSAYLILLSLLLLAACQSPAVAEESFVVADFFATPGKALATIELSPTPLPSPTIPNLPTPSAAPTSIIPTVIVLQPTLPIGTYIPTNTPDGLPTATATSAACLTEIPMPFAPIWQNFPTVQGLMGCPAGDLLGVEGVIQFYERGMMFWRQSDKSIFVLSDLAIRQGQESDSWWRVDDTFADGEPIDDPALQAPEGLRQPVRGFGKVWRNNAFIREAVGWAFGEEKGITSLWQMFDGGWMMTGPDNAPIYVLSPLDAPPYSSGIHLGPMP